MLAMLGRGFYDAAYDVGEFLSSAIDILSVLILCKSCGMCSYNLNLMHIC